MIHYGASPTVLARVELDPGELCFVQYLPIRMPNTEVLVPPALAWVAPLLHHICYGEDDYVYLTVKRIWASGVDSGNRPGWHSDGFGTRDINYVWYDSSPTEFAIQPFDLTSDCAISLREMEQQASLDNVVSWPCGSLLMLTEHMIHRSPTNCAPGFRTFVKISVSTDRYNLKGNAHNYMFDYDWVMVERAESRNHPSK